MTASPAPRFKRLRILGWLLVCLLGVSFAWATSTGTAPAASQRLAIVLDLQGAIGPASADYTMRGLHKAAERDASVVVLRMDTPGGLDTSMREIIRAILSSPVPVLTWVGPSGARAASAGTYIMYASHVAAMAPGTNLGAATPVAIGGFPSPGQDDRDPRKDRDRDRDARDGRDGREAAKRDGARGDDRAGARSDDKAERTDSADDSDRRDRDRAQPRSPMESKALNDAIAYIRSLAEHRGRNAEWAELAVREAASLGANAALKQNVIDIVATGIPHLLEQAHGRTVIVQETPVTLDTRDLVLEPIDPDWRNQMLAALTNPNLALILMMIGFYGLLFEFMNPGALYPGTIGAIALLLGLYSLSALPINYAGIALMVLGLALIVAEALSPSFGILGIGGTIALVLGATILIDTDMPAFDVSWPLIAGVAAAGLLFAMLAGRAAYAARGHPKETGREGMMHQTGQVLDWRDGAGHVWTMGERWQAVSTSPLVVGQRVHIVSIQGLTLRVEPDSTTTV
jgi:membrane-bound serine protease (ClpP class)